MSNTSNCQTASNGKKLLEEWIEQNNLNTRPFNEITKKLRSEIGVMNKIQLQSLIEENLITSAGSLTRQAYHTIISMRKYVD